MPKRSTTNAPTRITTAWTKRERRKLMRTSFERQQEGDEVDVLLRRQRLAEHRRHDALRIARHGPHSRRVQDLAHDVLGCLDLGDLREVGPDGRGTDLPRLVTGDAGPLSSEHRFARPRVARQLELGRRPSGRRGAGRLWNVVERHVDGAPERLEEGHNRPQLGPVEPDGRLVDARHDVRVPLDEVGAGIEERFDQVLLGGDAWLALGGAGADPGQVRGARALLADLVADLARAFRVEDLLPRLHQLHRRDVAALEGELLRGLRLDLGNRVAKYVYAPITASEKTLSLSPTGTRIATAGPRFRRRSPASPPRCAPPPCPSRRGRRARR